MKTTIELPDELFVAAKRRAAEDRTTLRAIVERGLRAQLRARRDRQPSQRRRAAIRWVTVNGGLPRGLDLRDRAAMHDWLRSSRT
jgi:Arc/MetJ family transcription regulator